MNLSLYTVTAFIVLDSDGNRVLSKYYTPRTESATKQLTTLKDQRAFEKGLWAKTKKPGWRLAVFKHSLDVIFYIVGNASENELMLHAALTAFFDAVSMLLRNQVEKRGVLESLDLVLLCLDETIDEGIIIETDSMAIASRVSRPKADSTDIVINEQTIMDAYQTVKGKLQQRISQL